MQWRGHFIYTWAVNAFYIVPKTDIYSSVPYEVQTQGRKLITIVSFCNTLISSLFLLKRELLPNWFTLKIINPRDNTLLIIQSKTIIKHKKICIYILPWVIPLLALVSGPYVHILLKSWFDSLLLLSCI